MRPTVSAILFVLALSTPTWCQWTVAVGDLDEDGLPDRVVARDGHLAVLAGQVDGTLLPLNPIPVSDGPFLAWLADLDGDSHLDLVTARQGFGGTSPATMGWAFGAGDGSFGPSTSQPVGDSQYSFLHSADLDDLDGDGWLDLVAVRQDAPGVDPDVSVFAGLGPSGFGQPQVLLSTRLGLGLALEVADVSGDGAADLLLGRYSGSSSPVPLVEIWLADPSGGWVAGPAIPTTGDAAMATAGHLDGDGLIDLVVSSVDLPAYSGEVSVHRGLGGGSFAPGQPVTGLPPAGYGVQIVDLDQDGHTDLLLPWQAAVDGEVVSTGSVVLRGHGDATFERWQDVAGVLGGPPTDVDIDGDLDLVDGSSGFTILGLGDGLLGVPPSIPVGDLPSDVVSARVDGDGRLDLIVLEQSGTRVRLLRGLPGARFELLDLVDPGFEVAMLRTTDLDGDGLADLVLGGAQLVALRGDGTGSFGPPHVLDVGLPPGAVEIGSDVLLGDLHLGDIEGDGVPDVLAVIHESTGLHGSTALRWASGLGDGTFAPPEPAFGAVTLTLATGDLDSDGRTDLVVRSVLDEQPFHALSATLLGTGDGSFVQAMEITPQFSGTLGLADLDGDGVPDLLAGTSPQNAQFYRGVGDGTLEAPVATSASWSGLAADVDGDGHVDLVGPASVVPGNGDGTFDEPVFLQAGSLPVATAVGDWNDDGHTDLAVANRGSDDVSVLLLGLETRWADLGGALAGTAGEPRLVAGGALQPGTPTTFILTRAAPAAAGFLVLGGRLAGMPFAGGVLWPLPEAGVRFATDADGRWQVSGRWPDGLPPEYELHSQAWIVDSAPFGLAASNGLTANVP